MVRSGEAGRDERGEDNRIQQTNGGGPDVAEMICSRQG